MSHTVVSKPLSASHCQQICQQAVINRPLSAGCCQQAVVSRLSSVGCWQTVVSRLLSGSRQAVVRQSSGSHQAVVRQSSGSHQIFKAFVSPFIALIRIVHDELGWAYTISLLTKAFLEVEKLVKERQQRSRLRIAEASKSGKRFVAVSCSHSRS